MTNHWFFCKTSDVFLKTCSRYKRKLIHWQISLTLTLCYRSITSHISEYSTFKRFSVTNIGSFISVLSFLASFCFITFSTRSVVDNTLAALTLQSTCAHFTTFVTCPHWSNVSQAAVIHVICTIWILRTYCQSTFRAKFFKHLWLTAIRVKCTVYITKCHI